MPLGAPSAERCRLDGRRIAGVSRSSRERRLEWFFGELSARCAGRSEQEVAGLGLLLDRAPRHGTALFAMGSGVAVQPTGGWDDEATRAVQYFVGTVSLALLARELTGEVRQGRTRRGLALCESLLWQIADESLLGLCRGDSHLRGRAKACLHSGLEAHQAYYSWEAERALLIPAPRVRAHDAFRVACSWGACKSAGLIGALAALGVVFRHRCITAVVDAGVGLFGSIQILDDVVDLGHDVAKGEPNALGALARFVVRDRMWTVTSRTGGAIGEELSRAVQLEDRSLLTAYRRCLRRSLERYRTEALKALRNPQLERRLRRFLCVYGAEVWRCASALGTEEAVRTVQRVVLENAVGGLVEDILEGGFVPPGGHLETWRFPWPSSSQGSSRTRPGEQQDGRHARV